MRLTVKIIVAAVLGILVVLGVSAWTRVLREIALFESQMRFDADLLGRTVAGAAARVWSTVGQAQALDVIDDANARQRRVAIRFVWLEAPPGSKQAPHAAAQALSAVREGVDVSLRESAEGAIYTYVPLLLTGLPPAALELRESLAEERAYIQRTWEHAAIVTLVLMAVCTLLVAGLGIVFIARPVQLLVDKAQRVGRGDLTGDLMLAQRDEMGQLAQEMNAMCRRLAEAHEKTAQETAARLRALEQLRHADRLMTVGKLASGLAHEVGTPLNVVLGTARLAAEERPGDAALRQRLDVIAQQTGRIIAIVRQLLDFARHKPPERAPCELRALAQQTVTLLEPIARRQGVTLSLAEGPPLRLAVDAVQLQQALTNLVVNAIQSMPQGGSVRLSVVEDRDQVRLEVKDEGRGIAPENLPRVFEPFFTTKEVGEGTGLGLSVAWGIVQEHGGFIEVASRPGEGSVFTISLPRGEPL